MNGGTLELTGVGQRIELAAFATSTGTFNMTDGTVITPDLVAGGGTANFNFAGGEIFLDGDQTGFDAANAWFNVTGDPNDYQEQFLAGPNHTRLFYMGGGGLDGDFDGNGKVNGLDLLLWQINPGVGSLTDWRNNYGAMASLSASSAAAVPEPTTLAMLLVTLITVGLHRGSRGKCRSGVISAGR